MEKLVKPEIIRNLNYRLKWPKDWVLKLISLLFAGFLWWFVAGEEKVEMDATVPVEIINLPQDLVIVNNYKKKLEITVNGPRGLIRDLEQHNVARTIDLSEAKPGTISIKNELGTARIPYSKNALPPSSSSVTNSRPCPS